MIYYIGENLKVVSLNRCSSVDHRDDVHAFACLIIQIDLEMGLETLGLLCQFQFDRLLG